MAGIRFPELVERFAVTLERAGITPTTSTQQATATPTCPVHQRPMKSSKRPGSFYCSAKVGDDYCSEKARQ